LELQGLCPSVSVGGQPGGVGADFILHPLIHTLLEVTLVQNAVGVQVNEVEKENPHRHGARKPMGDPTIERVNPMFTPVNL